jgi:hypothetical protein
MEDAKARRAWLCKEWLAHYDGLDPVEKSVYEPPAKYDLPIKTSKQHVLYQFTYQVNRAILVGWRNRFSKIVNSSIIVGSIVFITFLDGVTNVTVDSDPNLPFSVLVRPQTDELRDIFSGLFAYSQSMQLQ